MQVKPMERQPDRKTINRYLANWHEEMNGAELYRFMARNEKNEKLAGIYSGLADVEAGHAEMWAARLKELGVPLPVFRPSWRTRLLFWISLRVGVNAILPTVSSMEDATSATYRNQSVEKDIIAVEQSHARVLRQISKTTSGGVEGGILARLEGRHRAAGNALRAAVLGASDGLLSNFNLLMGVAGASLSSGTILLTGIAGLIAGGISMALGEWISVQSSRELYERQIQTEREEIAAAPEEEVEELVLIYQSRGLDESLARTLASGIMKNETTALDTLAREELGVDPGQLGGSAREAAAVSFMLFAAGAAVPLIPYLFLEGTAAIAASAATSGAGLFLIGAGITLFTGRSVWYSGSRQVVFGLSAAAVSFFVGRLIGVSLM